jgi:hypothetical protein
MRLNGSGAKRFPLAGPGVAGWVDVTAIFRG